MGTATVWVFARMVIFLLCCMLSFRNNPRLPGGEGSNNMTQDNEHQDHLDRLKNKQHLNHPDTPKGRGIHKRTPKKILGGHSNIAHYGIDTARKITRGNPVTKKIATMTAAVLGVVTIGVGAVNLGVGDEGKSPEAHKTAESAKPENVPGGNGAFSDEDYAREEPDGVHDGGRVADRGRDYPDTPRNSDLGVPAHVINQQVGAINQKTWIALGDSTIAYGNGNKTTTNTYAVGDKKTLTNPCRTEQKTWADTLGIPNYSCAGSTTKDLSSAVNTYKDAIKSASVITITSGSNDSRRGWSGTFIEKNLTGIVKKIKTFNPTARIVFIGYLPAMEGKCMTGNQRKSAKKLNLYHREGDTAMLNTAIRHKENFIDFSQTHDNPCASNAHIRLPGKKPGASWHTTPDGHNVIAREMKKLFG